MSNEKEMKTCFVITPIGENGSITRRKIDGLIDEVIRPVLEKLNYTARDHCPYCLYSKHLDINPGDRLNNCLGLLKPIDIEKFKNTYKIIYKCEKCGKFHKNVMANDDDINMIIKISKKD